MHEKDMIENLFFFRFASLMKSCVFVDMLLEYKGIDKVNFAIIILIGFFYYLRLFMMLVNCIERLISISNFKYTIY